MLILWDVYVRHRDPELLEWMKDKYQSILVLYTPANLTEGVQLLDRYFNASIMKRQMVLGLRNEQNAETLFDPMKSKVDYKPPLLMSELKEPFCDNLAIVLGKLQTTVKKQSFSDHCWKDGLFEKCFDAGFQRDSVVLVTNDQENTYFTQGGVDPVLSRDRRQIFQVANDFLDTLSERMADCTLQMASDLSNEKIVGKLVEPDQRCPGYVKSYNRSKDVFVVRYYRKGHGKKEQESLHRICLRKI